MSSKGSCNGSVMYKSGLLINVSARYVSGFSHDEESEFTVGKQIGSY